MLSQFLVKIMNTFAKLTGRLSVCSAFVNKEDSVVLSQLLFKIMVTLAKPVYYGFVVEVSPGEHTRTQVFF